MYDIIILGSGPAGLTAALYGARANKKTLILSGDSLYGTLNQIPNLENYPGWTGSGADLGKFMQKQAMDAGAELIVAGATSVVSRKDVNREAQDDDNIHDSRFTIYDNNGAEHHAHTVIIATGAKPRKMQIPGAREYIGKGVSYCATCDGAFYGGEDVVVIGGGNSALQDALYLANIAKSVKILYRKDSFARAEDVVVKRTEEAANISVMWNTEITEIGGTDTAVSHVITNKGERVDTSGVFIAIGHEANTDYLSEEIKRGEGGRLIAANLPAGMYVAGDVRDGIKLQVATAVGWGCEVAMDAISFLNESK
ncbi:MAG: FAD-dependent oxidoreductase [Alphaproteobacteria bacterium]|nr:FAD-dependent oxidoreductase [Alphaproteobacteria bacterium]